MRPGVRIWYRFSIPPSCRTVVFPANVESRDCAESKSEGAWRVEMWEGEPANMTRCLGNMDAIISRSLERRDSAGQVRSQILVVKFV